MLGRFLTSLLKHRSKQQVAASNKFFGRNPRQKRNRKARFEWLERRDLLSVEPTLAGLFGAIGSDDSGISGAEGEYSPATASVTAPMVQYRLALYDTNGQPLPVDANNNATIPVGEDFRLVGYHRDITYDDQDIFVGEGVYAAYVDIFHTNAHRLTVRYGETQQLDFYPLVQTVSIHGTFTLTFEGAATASISYLGEPGDTMDLAQRIEAALQDLPNIGAGNVQVSFAPATQDPPPGIRPTQLRVQFMNALGERDLPLLGIDSSQLNELDYAASSELYPADLSNSGTFRSSFSGPFPFINGVNAALKDDLDLNQPAGGSAWGVVGSFLDGFGFPSLNRNAEFAFFSVDIRASAPGRVEFSANAPSFEQGANQGFETLVFPTIPEAPKFVVDPADIHFLQTLDNPLVLNIAGPPTADIAGRSAEDGTWWVGESTGEQFVSSPWGGWPAIVDWQDVVVGDFTGDGRDDIAGRKDGVWWVARTSEADVVNVRWGAWSTTVDWKHVMVGDFTGNGLDDIVGLANGNWWVAVSTGTGFVTQRWGGWSIDAPWEDMLIADVNGDGFHDIVGRQNGVWWVARSTGTGFVNEKWGGWSTTGPWVDVHAADVNGDGKDDIVGRHNGYWWVARSTGTAFVNEKWGAWSANVSWVDVQVADVDGDGLTDIVGRISSTGDWWVAKSSGNSFINQKWGNWSPSFTWLDVQMADVNNNGRLDILGRNGTNGQWQVARSTGTSFTNEMWGVWSSESTWVDVRVADLNNDGRYDIVGRRNGEWWGAMSTGTNFDNVFWTKWPNLIDWKDVQVADVTGDGLDEIVARHDNGVWWIARSTEEGFVSERWGAWSTTVDWKHVMVGDFTGNGLDDIVGLANGNWWVAVSTGTGFVTRRWGGWSIDAPWEDMLIADVNGDGLDDIVGRQNGVWWVARSTGTGFVNEKWGGWSTTGSWVDVHAADVNGDGKDDIVGRHNGYWWVARSTGTAFVNEKWGAWSANVSWIDVQVADVDGDGLTDIVGRISSTGDWWVAKSTGNSFMNQRWGNWSPNLNWYNVYAADVNGDGRIDVLGLDSNGTWTVAKSTGIGFVNEAWGSWPADTVWRDVLVGNFSNRVPDAMYAAGLPPADHGPVAELTEANLQWIVDAAIPQLAEAVGWDAIAHPLDSITFQIADLPGTLLGQTLGTTILIDRYAAGFGWFVDRTPWDNEEFWQTTAGDLLSLPGGPADGRMDLLTVVMHELGHVLGFDHTDSGLMQRTLAPGVRYRWEDLLGDHLMDDGEGESAVDDFFATI